MIENELIKIWQSSSNQERIKFEKSKLMIELQASIDHLHLWWRYIERINIISALVTIPPFIFFAYWAPFILVKIASVLIIIWSIYVGIRLSSVKKLKPSNLQDNYLQYIEKTKAYLQAQKKMLETTLNWMILTIYPIILLFFVDIWEKPLARYIAISIFLALVVMGIYEYYLSKRRVKNEINPRIAKADKLIRELKG